MYVQNVVATLKKRLKIVYVRLRTYSAGLRYHAAAQHIVKTVRVKRFKVYVRIHFLLVDDVRHADEVVTVKLRKFRSYVGVGIGKKNKHTILLFFCVLAWRFADSFAFWALTLAKCRRFCCLFYYFIPKKGRFVHRLPQNFEF